MRSLRHIFSFGVVMAVALSSFAQEPAKEDTTIIPADTAAIAAPAQPQADSRRLLSLHVNYLPVFSRLTSGALKYEGGISIFPLKNLSAVAEFGYNKAQPRSAITNGEYTSEGCFGKAGLDYYFINQPESRIYLGVRYAQSRFADEYSFEITSDLWPLYREENARENLRANWFEVLFGTEGRILFNGLYTGWTFRYRILSSGPVFKPVPVYHIPGFGQALNDNAVGLTLYLRLVLF